MYHWRGDSVTCSHNSQSDKVVIFSGGGQPRAPWRSKKVWGRKSSAAQTTFWNERSFRLYPRLSVTCSGITSGKRHTVWYNKVKSQLAPTEGTLSWLMETVSVPSVRRPLPLLLAQQTEQDVVGHPATVPGRVIFNASSSLNKHSDVWLRGSFFSLRGFGNRPHCLHVRLSRWQTDSCQILQKVKPIWKCLKPAFFTERLAGRDCTGLNLMSNCM